MSRLLPIVKITASLFFVLAFSRSYSQNYSAGINTETPNSNAVLHLVSPDGNQGLLIPQLSTAQRTGMPLSAADNGLLVFDDTDGLFYYWLDPSWFALSDSQNLSLTGTTLSIDNGNSIDLATINVAENDPTVPDALKDGVDWTELSGIPVDFQDNIDNIDDADNDPTNEIELPATAVANQVLTWDGVAWVAAGSPADGDSDPTNEIELPATATINQVLLWDGASWVAGPDAVDDADNDPTNEVETWTTLAGIPAGFADDTDDGLTAVAVDGTTITGDGNATQLAVGTVPAASVSGLGTAATLDAGTLNGNLVQLPADGVLPALDASALTNITPGANTIDSSKIINETILSEDILNGTIVNIDVSSAAAIDVLKLSAGLVSNAEFDFLDGLDQNLTTTSNVTFNGVSATNGAFSSLGVSTTALLNGNTNLGNEATDQITVTGGIIFDEATQDVFLNVNDQSVAGGQLIIPDIQGNTRTFAFQETSSVFNVVGGNYFSNATNLPAVTTGTENVLIGTNAGANITTATNNVFFGLSAGLNNDTGTDNIAIGNAADTDNATDPSRAIAIGNNALVSSDFGIALGTNASASGNTAIAIGTDVTSPQDFSIVLGDNTPTYSVGINTATPTEELEVEGDVRVNGSFITPPNPGILNVVAVTLPSPTERIIKIDAAIPNISFIDDTNAVEGQEVILINVGISDVDIDDILPGNGSFLLGTTGYTMKTGGTLHLIYVLNPAGDGFNRWVEIGRASK